MPMTLARACNCYVIAGELTSRMGTALDQPTAPANLAMGASAVALVLGGAWTWRALAALSLPEALMGLVGRLPAAGALRAA